VGPTFRLLYFFRLTEGVDAVPKDIAQRVCAGFAQLGVHRAPAMCHFQIVDCRLNGLSLGARGTSVLFSTGDGGVGGRTDTSAQWCTTDDGTIRFIPIFPASCP
jgi:hypothetical protein